MNKQVILLSALFSSLLVSFAARAVETTELKVKGSIRPPACIPGFSGGGEVDFGNIKAATLKAGQYTALPEKQIDFTVSCDQNARVTLSVTDNRSVSRFLSVFDEEEAIQTFGLGSVDGKKVGVYRLKMSAPTLDGTAVNMYYTKLNGSVQGTYGVAALLTNTNDYLFGFANGTNRTIVGKLLNVSIKVEARLNKPENLNLTGDIPLDGSATFEIQYQ